MESLSFEQLMNQLEQVVKELESKDISLDDAVTKYQLGIKLAKECQKRLKDAEKVIVKEVETQE